MKQINDDEKLNSAVMRTGLGVLGTGQTVYQGHLEGRFPCVSLRSCSV